MKLLIFISALFFGVHGLAYTFERDVPANIKNQFVDDMSFMSSIQGTQVSALHKKIFGDLNGSLYQTFFENRVKTVGMDDCGSPNAVACVIPWLGSNRIWLTQNFVKFSHPQISRLMVVYHEARHTEVNNGNWSHATCPVPFLDKNGQPKKSIWTGAPLAGEPACDVTPYGSYGSSMILLKNISKFCTNCNEKVKMDASLYADDQFGRVIDAGAISEIEKDLY
jgi:hypothetical protein